LNCKIVADDFIGWKILDVYQVNSIDDHRLLPFDLLA
jgi:hypothetical protein